ncbi:hypothetical protein C3747_252g7 [Trypanosoma cruzi]|uniref:Uncharacterized protein n=1 Tax=Trypanosoma cruzi TaxID=5693 RepID=A0A2V2VKD2_TRYCR|nr:hypothetical protein C3747_252g7 [Trypanosoma cruzi]
MYYFRAEKQGTYFEGWSMRLFAFDSQRRHMYYTEREKCVNRSPNGATETHWPTGSPTAPPWKKKFKVTKLVVVSTVHEFHLDDPHLKETDFFTLELHGRTRALASDEPPAEPLLIPAATEGDGLQGATLEPANRDPFRLCQLYELLRDQFSTLSRNQGLRATASAISVSSQSALSETDQVRTIQSPRSTSAKERHIVATIRCCNEEDFRQVWYIVQMVLGFDRLTIRPYRGLPPYDPRNGIPFGHIPMHLWHTFMELENSVFYVFIRGDLVGHDHEGNAEVWLPNAYLCITHDMVLVMRENGTIPRWIHLYNVNTFEYNTVAKRPFFAFLTDDPSPDVLFIPKPPVYGPVAISNFSGKKVVLNVCSILREACFASNGIRRATEFLDADWASSVREYFNTKEKTRRFKFSPLDGFDHSFSCLIPKVHLARVWREVLREQNARSHDDVAAIPLEGTGGQTILSGADMKSVRHQMEVERSRSHDEIVGMPLDKLLGHRRERLNASMEAPKIRPDNFSRNPTQGSEEVVYQEPGAQYICPDTSLKVSNTGREKKFGLEGKVDELVNASFAAMGIAKPSS